ESGRSVHGSLLCIGPTQPTGPPLKTHLAPKRYRYTRAIKRGAMKRILGMTALVLLLAACAPAAPSADDSAVQTAVAALLTQQAPAATEATQVEETAPDLSGGAPTSIVPTTESFP